MLKNSKANTKQLMQLARSKSKAKNSLRSLIQTKSARHKNNQSLNAFQGLPRQFQTASNKKTKQKKTTNKQTILKTCLNTQQVRKFQLQDVIFTTLTLDCTSLQNSSAQQAQKLIRVSEKQNQNTKQMQLNSQKCQYKLQNATKPQTKTTQFPAKQLQQKVLQQINFQQKNNLVKKSSVQNYFCEELFKEQFLKKQTQTLTQYISLLIGQNSQLKRREIELQYQSCKLKQQNSQLQQQNIQLKQSNGDLKQKNNILIANINQQDALKQENSNLNAKINQQGAQFEFIMYQLKIQQNLIKQAQIGVRTQRQSQTYVYVQLQVKSQKQLQAQQTVQQQSGMIINNNQLSNKVCGFATKCINQKQLDQSPAQIKVNDKVNYNQIMTRSQQTICWLMKQLKKQQQLNKRMYLQELKLTRQQTGIISLMKGD